MELEKSLDERVVLTTKSEVCWAGRVTDLMTVRGTRGVMVRLDERSGLSVWCPEEFIKELLVVPIPKG